jgi:hypothetical protein
MDPIMDPIHGAFHHDLCLRALKNVISKSCPTMNAVHDASAIRISAKYHDATIAIGRLNHAPSRARLGPRVRFERSVTR